MYILSNFSNLNPNHGVIKLIDRGVDLMATQRIHPKSKSS
jgi:hypothetical protein